MSTLSVSWLVKYFCWTSLTSSFHRPSFSGLCEVGPDPLNRTFRDNWSRIFFTNLSPNQQWQSITSGQSDLTKGRITAAHGRLIRICQPRHPSRRWMHSSHAGDNANTAPEVDERICRCEGWQVRRHVPSLPLHMERSGPHLIHGSLGPPKFINQTASWSVQPFLQGSGLWETDHATRSVTVGRIYVCKGKERKGRVFIYRLFAQRYIQSAQAWITQFYLQTTPCLPFLLQRDLKSIREKQIWADK